MARRTVGLIAILFASTALGADDPVRVRFGWSRPGDCRREAKIVDGRLQHVGKNPIRDVTVCFGGDCAAVAGGAVIASGESVPLEMRSSGKPPTIRCSILEERAGA